MSLEALAQMRSKGQAPVAVWVTVGPCSWPGCIAVTESPERMDWRPVVGLHVDVFDVAGNPELLNRTIDAIDTGYPQAVSVACSAGVVGLTPKHEETLHSIWRHLASHP